MTPLRRLRAIIVDDESLARRRIRDLLAADPDVEVVAECANGMHALQSITNLEPDLLFLDIQMPEMDGFAVLRRIEADHVPVIVFVTAYEQYALRAFEASAVDYLLKPFHRIRFLQALGKAKMLCSAAELACFRQRVGNLLSDRSRLAVRSGRTMLLVPVAEIDWIEAANNYVCLHCGAKTHIVRETLRSLEARLDGSQFARIHRSVIVNLNAIREIRPSVNGDAHLLLEDGTRLTASRTFSPHLERLRLRE